MISESGKIILPSFLHNFLDDRFSRHRPMLNHIPLLIAKQT